jgi:hypothetical protein
MNFPAQRLLAPLAVAVALAGCTGGDQDGVVPLAQVRGQYGLGPVEPRAFSVCHEHGCQERTPVGLDQAEWGKVRAIFQPPSRDGAEERARISLAIGLIEMLVGPKAGTSGDVGGTFEGVGRGKGQLDCEDEAANTTQYLSMMQNDGLIKFHAIAGWAWRGHFINGWPHTATVIEALADKTRWSVDSWFENNGKPAHVVPLSQWKSGWSPN